MARNYTAELKLALAQGATIHRSSVGEEEVVYAPRSKGDRLPWLLKTDASGEWRYSGRECHAMKDGKVYTPVKPVRVMTEDQKHALRCLAERNGGVWYPGCGWVWANRSTTLRILDGLVKRGYAKMTDSSKYNERYELTKAGLAEYERLNPWTSVVLETKAAELVEWMKSDSAETVRRDPETMWVWHDFRIIVRDAQEDGTVRFSVGTKGINMPLLLSEAPSRDEAMLRAARSVMARTMKRAQVA